MKNIKTYFLTLIIATTAMVGCGTMSNVKAPPELRKLERIVEISNQPKDDLYINANSWFVETFNSAESVIEFQDKEAGKIMGKYVFSYSEGIYFYDVRQTISIDLRDNRARIIISDPYYRATGDVLNGSYGLRRFIPLESKNGIDRARQEWGLLISSLTTALKRSTDW